MVKQVGRVMDLIKILLVRKPTDGTVYLDAYAISAYTMLPIHTDTGLRLSISCLNKIQFQGQSY